MTEKQAPSVFIRLPLNNQQLGKLLFPNGTISDRLRAIGTPVDSSVPVVCTINDCVPLVRQSDHLAALAEKQAEVERLREILTPFSDAADRFDADGNEYERDYPDSFDLASGMDDEETTIGMTVGDLRKARSALTGTPS